MKKSTAYALIFIVLLIAVTLLCVFRLVGGKPAEPAETEPVGTEEPAATRQPEQTDEPEQTEAPTAPPVTPPPPTKPPETPRPTDPPAPDASGSFASNTGTGLNLAVEWSAKAGSEDSAALTLDVYVTSYRFFTDALPYSMVITVDGVDYTVGTSAVSYDGETQTRNKIASCTAQIPRGRSADIDVVWNYRGSYGGTELENISAHGSAYVG